MWKEEATSESIDNGRMNSAEKIVLSNPINVLKAILIFDICTGQSAYPAMLLMQHRTVKHEGVR
jgi:hypothetical protein